MRQASVLIIKPPFLLKVVSVMGNREILTEIILSTCHLILNTSSKQPLPTAGFCDLCIIDALCWLIVSGVGAVLCIVGCLATLQDSSSLLTESTLVAATKKIF